MVYMVNLILCSLEPQQILSYLRKEKDCELRKVKPNPEKHIDSSLEDSKILVKTKGSTLGYILGTVDNVFVDDPQTIYEKYHNKYKFGIDKKKYDKYYRGSNRAVLIHFEKIELLDPPLDDLPGTQTFRYIKRTGVNPIFISNKIVVEKLVKKTNEIKKNLEE